MNLFDVKTYIRQILPPHWRNSYKYSVLAALLAPVQRIYGEFTGFRKDLRKDINLNAQVGVLETYLNRTHAIAYGKHIEIVDGDTTSTVKILIKTEYMPKLEAIKADVSRYVPLGVKVEYNQKTTQ